ncbi:hypothetical protein GCM10010297_41050 [Streptomyces malachitofuscus]|nr:hypothetical protein GCM10010297_41050 [Streptomyces malachitofuscus]
MGVAGAACLSAAVGSVSEGAGSWSRWGAGSGRGVCGAVLGVTPGDGHRAGVGGLRAEVTA